MNTKIPLNLIKSGHLRVTDNKIVMNIGSNIGVQIGQQYKVNEGVLVLKVNSVASDISYLKFQTSHGKLLKGLKVIEITN